MNKFYIFFLVVFFPFLVLGQKKKKQDYTLQKADNMVLDGDLKEWEGKLYNTESELWSFGVSTDGAKLYVAVRIKDDALQREALRSGIFVNVSYDGKKRDGARLLYPFVDRERLRALRQDEDLDMKNIKEELLKSARGYQISGFSTVVDGLLSFDNTYGIQAVARFSETRDLIYESEIPLELIKFESDQMAVQVGVNTQFSQMKKVAESNTRASNVRIYGMAPTGPNLKNPYKEETAVWLFGRVK